MPEGGDGFFGEGFFDAEESLTRDREQVELEWMWADAGVLPLIGGVLASANPYRWSNKGRPNLIAAELDEQSEDRAVSLRSHGQAYAHKFDSPAAAAIWIRNTSSDHHAGSADIALLFAGKLAAAAAEPALAWMVYRNTKKPWPGNNIFSAYAYAHKTIQLPLLIAAAQKRPGQHPRIPIDWGEFNSSKEQMLTSFVAAVKDRPEQLRCQDGDWTLVGHDMFWVAYTCAATGSSVLAFRGGDGGSEDAKAHFGSPARSFVLNEDEAQVPALLMQPVELCRKLATDGSLCVVGYSQGGIPAMACALMLGAEEGFTKCVLFNCATMFWPKYLDLVLPENWWDTPLRSIKGMRGPILSYIVTNDPLSEGLPGGDRAPQTPGTTYVLPAVAHGARVIENHAFELFVNADGKAPA
jgi:hypothetical protein